MKLLLLAALVGCQIPAPVSPITPHSAAESTFLVNVVGVGSGTAWIAKNGDTSVLITAGHVCEPGALYVLRDRRGESHMAVLKATSPKYDLCALETFKVIGRPLGLAPHEPELYDPVSYVGAPTGMFGCSVMLEGDFCGFAPMYRGEYLGGNAVSAPTAPGASGSAIYADYGVIGVLTSVSMRFNSLTYFVPRAHLAEFLAEL